MARLRSVFAVSKKSLIETLEAHHTSDAVTFLYEDVEGEPARLSIMPTEGRIVDTTQTIILHE